MKRRTFSMLLVLCMMVSFFPASAFADEGNALNPEMEPVFENEVASADDLEAFTEPQEPEVPAHEHVYIPTVTEPTCTTQGYTTYTCACGDSYAADYTDALNHPQVVEIPETPATEASTGTTSGTKCALCGQILSGCEVIPMPQPSPAGDQMPAVAPEATRHTSLHVTEPSSENEQEQNVQPAAQNASDDAVSEEKVTVLFEIDPADAIITVYSKNELGEVTEYDPEEDGTYLLLPGEYYYTLQADGYTGIEEERLEVRASEEPVTITAVLDVMTDVEVSPEEEQELEAQIEEETERREAKEAVVASGTCGDNVTWKLDEQGVLTISGTGLMTDYTYDSCPFRSYSDQIKTVSIEKGVTGIGKFAFRDCHNVTRIIIPEGMTDIGFGAFEYCSSLTSVVIPESVTGIGYYAFCGCSSLTSVVIPDSVTRIGQGAFSKCSSLTSIVIPASVTTIDYATFNECSSLTSIMIPESVMGISNKAFYGCSSLMSIEIPRGVSNIWDGTFSGCSSLTSITIPSSVTNIGNSAFLDCSQLAEVFYSGSVAQWRAITIGTKNEVLKTVSLQYEKCGNNLSWELDEDGTLSITGNGQMEEYYNDQEYADYEYWLPPWYKDRDRINRILIADGATNISDNAFFGCGSLTSITIPSSVTRIGYETFSGCSALIDVYYNSTLSQWEHVQGKESLESVRVHCTKCGDNLTWELDENGVLTITGNGPMEDFDNTDAFTPWYSERNSILTVVLSNGVTYISRCAFQYCNSMTSIIIPDSVTAINYWAFENCSSLTSITIPDSVTNIGEHAFSGCNGLTDIKLPEGLASIEWAAFSRCSALTSITIPEGVTRIDGYAFSGCSSLLNITLPESVTSVGEYAFSDCSSLERVSIPAGVTDIGYDSFSGCAALTDVYYSGTPNQWHNIYHSSLEPLNTTTLHCAKCGENLAWSLDEEGTLTITGTGPMDNFYNAEWSDEQSLAPWYNDRDKIKDVVLTDGVTHIGDYAFQNCTNLKTVTMPKSVTSIGENVALNSGLTDVYYGGTKEEIAGITLGENSETMQQVIVRCSDGIYGYSGTWGDNITWRLEENGVFTLSGTGEMYDLTTEEGNWNWNETYYPWYFYRDRIKKLVVEPGVTSISPYAFRFSALEEAVFPEGLTRISRYAFNKCYDLSNAPFPSTLKELGEYAFGGTAIASFNVSAAVTEIGDGALGSWNLVGIFVDVGNPYFVNDGNGILYGVNQAASVWVNQNSSISFDNCYRLITAPNTLSGNITVNSKVQVIEAEAFSGCRNITSLTLPASLKGIDYWAFEACSLSYIRFQGEAPVFSRNAFAGAGTLTCYYKPGSTWTNNVFQNYSESDSNVRVTWKAYSSGLTLNTNDITMSIGESKTISATGNGRNSVSWKSSNPDAVEVSQTGVVTGKKLGRATITATAGNFTESCTVRVLFSDVQDPSQFYYDYVYEMANRGIVGGFNDGSFRPNNNCNRAAVVTFLWRMAGRPEPGAMASFSDMTGNSDFDKAISWAAEQGITTGWEEDNTFRPWVTCNRAAIVTFLWRFAGRPEPVKMATFNDMTGNSDFDKAISWAAEKGITTGWSDNTFRPWNTCLRLAVVSFLSRYDAL